MSRGEPVDIIGYKAAYNRGWRHSSTVSASLDNNPYPWTPRVIANATSNALNDAWEDGYLDYATGREKWHLMHCKDHEACP